MTVAAETPGTETGLHYLQTKNEVIRSEEMTKGSGSDTIHGAWLQIHQDSSGNIFGGWKDIGKGKGL